MQAENLPNTPEPVDGEDPPATTPPPVRPVGVPPYQPGAPEL